MNDNTRKAIPMQSPQPQIEMNNDSAIEKETSQIEAQDVEKKTKDVEPWKRPFAVWSMNNEPISATDGHPLIAITADALGISGTEMTANSDVLQSVVEHVVNLIRSDDPTDLFKFISFHLRRSPAGPGKLRNFNRYLEIMRNESGVKNNDQ